MRNAEAICSLLLTRAHIPRDELPELKEPALRADVEERLEAAGMNLVDTPYSDHYAARPIRRADDDILTEASSLGLREHEAAMLVILWCKLALPERLPDHPRPYRIHPDTVEQEFKDTFGSTSNAARAMGRLENLGFLKKEKGYYVAGPAMETMIDGSRMVDFVNQRALLLEARDRALKMVDDRGIGPREIILEYFQSTDDWLYPRDVISELELEKQTAYKTLRQLEDEGVLEAEGHGRGRRYRRTG